MNLKKVVSRNIANFTGASQKYAPKISVSLGRTAFRVAERIHAILTTSHDKILKESEAEQVLAGMGMGAKENADNENVKELNKMVKEVEKKTGGLL